MYDVYKLSIPHIPSQHQVADFFTKSYIVQRFPSLFGEFSVCDPPWVWEGCWTYACIFV